MADDFIEQHLWTLTKNAQPVEAVIRHIPGVGIDLRFSWNGELRESKLFRGHTAPIDVVTEVTTRQADLIRRGWAENIPPSE